MEADLKLLQRGARSRIDGEGQEIAVASVFQIENCPVPAWIRRLPALVKR